MSELVLEVILYLLYFELFEKLTEQSLERVTIQ